MPRIEENDSGRVLYLPSVKTFTDTGFIEHQFTTKAKIIARPVPSTRFDDGADIELIIYDSDGKKVCQITLDKFTTLCLVDALVKNLVNQEELEYEHKRGFFDDINRGNSFGGECEAVGS